MSLVFLQTEELKFSRLFMTCAFLFDRSTLGQTNQLFTTSSSLRRPQIQINSPKYRGLTWKPTSLSSVVWDYTNEVQKRSLNCWLDKFIKNLSYLRISWPSAVLLCSVHFWSAHLFHRDPRPSKLSQKTLNYHWWPYTLMKMTTWVQNFEFQTETFS